MSKQQWKQLWKKYRTDRRWVGSKARTLVRLEAVYGYDYATVALLAKVVLAADDSFGRG